MTTLLLLVLQLLQSAGVPVELAHDGTIVLAARVDSQRGRTAQARVGETADTDPLVEEFASPCDISNGF
jgi:hypothetical protein